MSGISWGYKNPKKPKQERVQGAPCFNEENSCCTLNIARRKLSLRCLCGGHKWMNAHMHWEVDSYNTPLETPDNDMYFGFSLARLCKHCKKIDCIHCFTKERVYEDRVDSVHVDVSVVSFCCRCEKWIYISGVRQCEADDEAFDLIKEVVGDTPVPASPNIGTSVTSYLRRGDREGAIQDIKNWMATGRCTVMDV